MTTKTARSVPKNWTWVSAPSDQWRELIGRRAVVTDATAECGDWIGTVVDVLDVPSDIKPFDGNEPVARLVSAKGDLILWVNPLANQLPIWKLSALPGSSSPTTATLADDFAGDLKAAIDYVRVVATEGFHRIVQPQIKPGCTVEEAISEVCRVMVLRALDGHWVEGLLSKVLGDVEQMLLSKNAAYGNSALDPLRVFSKASIKEQLLVRLDDKVSRISRGSAAGEDVAGDILGYLVLLRIAMMREAVGNK